MPSASRSGGVVADEQRRAEKKLWRVELYTAAQQVATV
jgi:hypothetical protein